MMPSMSMANNRHSSVILTCAKCGAKLQAIAHLALRTHAKRCKGELKPVKEAGK
jgi:hypothetical protein